MNRDKTRDIRYAEQDCTRENYRQVVDVNHAVVVGVAGNDRAAHQVGKRWVADIVVRPINAVEGEAPDRIY